MPSPLSKFMPYRDLLDEATGSPLLVKTQALVSVHDKRTILAALGGDDGVFTLMIQSTFKRTADFIRSNNLNLYDTSNYARVLDFIRYGTDTRAPIDAPAHVVPGPTENRQRPAAPTPSVAPTRLQGRPRGDGRKTVKIQKD